MSQYLGHLSVDTVYQRFWEAYHLQFWQKYSKIACVQVTKAYGGVDVELHSFLTFALDESNV